jgi:organic radical activating enzyme
MRQKTVGEKAVRLSEIFTSIEGEGLLFGTKTMFVRMAGCPLKCHWCDTPDSLPIESGKEYSVQDAKSFISESLQPNTYKVNFTGGEPLAQHEALIELARFAKEEQKLRTYLESACYDSSRFAKVMPFFDICKIEFKLRDSKVVDEGNHDNLLNNELECLRLAILSEKTTYIKIVVTNSSSVKEFRDLVYRVFNIAKPADIAGFIIQPSHKIDEPTLERLFEFYDAVYPFYEQVRIVPQMHKAIGAR